MFFDVLPPELKMKIMNFLGSKDLKSFGCTSNEHNTFANDDRLWKALLIRDFYFTKKSLKYYIAQIRLSESDGSSYTYEQFYKYCQTSKSPSNEETICNCTDPNCNEPTYDYVAVNCEEALEYLETKGLTENHFKGRLEFYDFIPDSKENKWINHQYFTRALRYLMGCPKLPRKEATPPSPNLSATEAVATLRGLNTSQAYGISYGLTREEVLLCNNIHIIDTLIRLKPFGLTSDLLSLLEAKFSLPLAKRMPFKTALVYLMEEHDPRFTAEQAVLALQDKTPEEARAIYKGQKIIEPNQLPASTEPPLPRCFIP